VKIVFLDSTALPGSRRGPGSPAFFSRYAIQHLQQQGHEIVIIGGYEDAVCLPADVVIAEWCNEVAYQAAARPLKKLVIRMRGYDAYGPLDQLKWENVDALVYESPLLKEIAEERFVGLRGFRSHVIPSGVDVANIPWRDHNSVARDIRELPANKIVALVARTTSDKGYQLAYEWARTRQDIDLHVTGALGDTNPRLVSYLKHAAPPNVVVHGTVDTIPWLEEIQADFLLSASIHESLGYVIAEAMAMGIKPLIHDAPGITTNWPPYLTWRSFFDLDRLIAGPYDSQAYRDFIEQRLDAAKCSADFAALLAAPSTRAGNAVDVEALRRYSYERANRVFSVVRKAIAQPSDMRAIDEVVTDYRSRLEPHSISSTERYGVAMATAVAHFNHENYVDAEVWACRAMLDFARPDALCLMGECADARGAAEDALQWYEAACAMADVPDRYRFPELVENRFSRRDELKEATAVKLPPAPVPERYIVIVTVRNGAEWIKRCLESIRNQTVTNFECIVVDDCSTDGTGEIAEHFGNPEGGLDDDRFFVQRNTVRRFQAYNMVQAARTYATRPEDVVVFIDGDDWLLHDRAFERIQDAYADGAWMTYGCLIESTGNPTRFGRYPINVARESRFREHVWCATPPRTFKRFLLDELKDEDFMVEGKWPEMAGDVCVYTPIMELAAERTVGIREPIYVYNTETPDNEHKVDPYEATRIRDLLLQRPPKRRLERA
jgi:glycosyltransferase involved in cell wall biosynthesis